MKLRNLLAIFMAMVFVFSGLNADARMDKKKSKAYYKKAKKQKRKNLPLAVTLAAKSVKEKNDNKSAVKFLVKYHEKLYAKEAKMIASIKSSGKEFFNDELFYLYKSLTEMYDEIASLPELDVKKYKGYKFRTHNYKDDLTKTRTAAADAHYNKGMSLIGSSDIMKMKEGIGHLNASGKFEADYRNFKKSANDALINKANDMLASGSRIAKADVAFIYEKLLYNIDGVNLPDLRAKARTLKKEALMKVYVAGTSYTTSKQFKPDNRYLINILSDANVGSAVAKDPKSNLSSIASKANAVCYPSRLKVTDLKVAPRKSLSVKEYVAYNVYETDFAGKKTKLKETVTKSSNKILYALYKAADNKGTLKENKSIEKIVGKVSHIVKEVNCNVAAVFELVDASTGEKLKSFSYSVPYKKTYEIKYGYGNKKAIPKKIRTQEVKELLNMTKTENVQKDAKSTVYRKFAKDFKQSIIKIYK